jgi:AraC family transcriptional regulator, positive regulator of tynA and feaB
MAQARPAYASPATDWNGRALPGFVPIPDGADGVERAICSHYFPFEIEPSSAAPLTGAIDSFSIGAVQMTRIFANGSFHGRRKRVQPREPHYYMLGLIEEGGSIEIDSGRMVTIAQGDLYLMNSRDRFESRQTGPNINLGVAFDAAMLKSRFAEVDDWCFRRIDTSEGTGAVLRGMLESIWNQRHSLDGGSANGLMAAAANLLGATFAPRRDVPASLSQSSAMHFLRLRELVSAHLDHPELSVDFLAERLGLSRAMIFKLMAQANMTLGAFIMEKRLEWARALLADTGAKQCSVSEIAFTTGFQDLSHFSRRFAARYGASPRAFRDTLARPPR